MLNYVEIPLHEKEKELLKQIELFPEVIQNAAQNHSPALLANYTYDLVKEYNSFYQAVPILGEENLNKKIDELVLMPRTFRSSRSEVVKAAVLSLAELSEEEIVEILS